MELGKRQKLVVARKKDFGAYLCEIEDVEGKEAVLLPLKQVPSDAEVGSEIEVFIYKDSQDRLIATTRTTYLEAGQTGKLKVKEVSPIGAFLDNGLEKDILLPFKETVGEIKPDDQVLVALYVDRSQRLAATMKVYNYLISNDTYQKDDEVTGTVYEVKDMGIFVAVDDKYFGLIPHNEVFINYKVGDSVTARVMRVREDGKIDLSPRKKVYMQIEEDAELIEKKMDELEGVLPFTDKSDAELIKNEFGLSKNAFKRAVGHLLKANKIEITEGSIKKRV